MIEDNPVDVDLLRLSFEQHPEFSTELIICDDGERAVNMLGEFADGKRKPLPDFIVLDYNIPRVDGGEVLQFARTKPALQGIPVAVLSSSPRDVVRSRLGATGADGYFTKPLHLDEFLEIGGKLRQWFEQTKRAA